MGKFVLVARLAVRDVRHHKAQAILLLLPSPPPLPCWPWAWPSVA
jgi:hypothetical protein